MYQKTNVEIKRIREEISHLDWRCKQETQERAIDFLSKIEEKYYSMIFKEGCKYTWENSVRIAKMIGYPRNVAFIPDLLKMMQDLNWPGAEEAIEVLADMDLNSLLPQLKETIETAFDEDDAMWLGGLNMVVEELENKHGVRLFSEERVYELLKEADF